MKRCLHFFLFIFMTHFIFAQNKLGGSDAPDGKYLYQGALRNKSKFICGTSVITKTAVLTAAHCIKEIQTPADATVVVGTININDQSGTEYKVRKLIAHERYNKRYEHANDIGIIFVSGYIIFNDKVQPVNLPRQFQSSYENTKAILAGWGTQTNDSVPSSTLQHVELRVINLKVCAIEWKTKRKRFILQSQLCTSGWQTENVVTHGDSGGALVADNVQIGILSFAWDDLPDVFTRVTSYIFWIQKQVYIHSRTNMKEVTRKL